MGVHDFKSSLKKGHAGELLFLSVWPAPLQRLDGRKHDYRLIGTDRTLELKTDSYDHDKTCNFFIELWSDVDKDKVGGPWQARNNGTTHWAYFFTQNLVVYYFDTDDLASWVDDNWKAYSTINIPNKSWTTVGVKVPRADLKHLYKSYTIITQEGQ